MTAPFVGTVRTLPNGPRPLDLDRAASMAVGAGAALPPGYRNRGLRRAGFPEVD